MSIVTLTGHLGSMGTIATRVATTLGYTLADRELLLEAAQALGWGEADVAAFDERTEGRGSRLAHFLQEFFEHAPIDDIDASGGGNGGHGDGPFRRCGLAYTCCTYRARK